MDDEDLKFTDQVAIRVMSGLLAREDIVAATSIRSMLEHHPHDRVMYAEKLEKMALFSYRVAQAMRKAKLVAFK